MRRASGARSALAVALAVVTLSACNSPARKDDATGVTVAAPTASDASAATHTTDIVPRGTVVVVEAAARKVLQTCSRPSPDDKGNLPLWTPAPSQIVALERALPALSARFAHVADSARQYIGIVKNGKRVVYVNAWPAGDGPFIGADGKSLDLSRVAISVCDGASAHWGALWDPDTGEFFDFQANGPH